MSTREQSTSPTSARSARPTNDPQFGEGAARSDLVNERARQPRICRRQSLPSADEDVEVACADPIAIAPPPGWLKRPPFAKGNHLWLASRLRLHLHKLQLIEPVRTDLAPEGTVERIGAGGEHPDGGR